MFDTGPIGLDIQGKQNVGKWAYSGKKYLEANCLALKIPPKLETPITQPYLMSKDQSPYSILVVKNS